MKADKREIVTFVIAALATLVAVWFFLGKKRKIRCGLIYIP